MKLTVLVDNAAIIDRYFLAEPAVSYLLEDGGARILLDTGYSDVFLKNARAMGIDLSRVTDIVLSHGHNDHTGGLAAYFAAFPQTRVRLTACPGVFAPRRDDAGLSIGSPLTQEAACAQAEVRLSDEPVRLSEHVTFLGRIPRRTDFEARTPIGVRLDDDGQWTGDLLPDDSALALETAQGLFLLLGCSHSGVCNIVLQAQALFPGVPVRGLLGGMHLMRRDAQAEKTVEFLRTLPLTALYPSHCTAFAVRAQMAQTLPVRDVGVGMTLEL